VFAPPIERRHLHGAVAGRPGAAWEAGASRAARLFDPDPGGQAA